MANLTKKVLLDLLKQMLAHIPSPDEIQANKYQVERAFSGDDSWMRIAHEGMPPIELRADPSRNLEAV
jgi:hypothetical protein